MRYSTPADRFSVAGLGRRYQDPPEEAAGSGPLMHQGAPLGGPAASTSTEAPRRGEGERA
jgi:hypothetical protein